MADDASGTNLAPIGGATAQTYVVASADLGRFLRVRVTPNGSATHADSAYVQSRSPKPLPGSLGGAAGAPGCGFGAALAAVALIFGLRLRRSTLG